MSERHSMSGWIRAGIAGVLVVGAMIGGALMAATLTGRSVASDAAVGLAASRGTIPVSGVAPRLNTTLDGLPDLVDRVRGSVVTINVTTGASPGVRAGQGLGTGIVLDRQGDILTNYHVVDGADQITVKFSDGTLTRARVIGSDPGNDMAVIRVNLPESALSPAAFGNSDQVRLGEPVFAIGNPFSLEFTVTTGVVSGLNRQSGGQITGRPIRSVIQTDAVVNPGNSGGPLFNANGEVIGINSSIENPTGQAVWVGVGFAISSNTALRFIPDMIGGRPITHPQLGVSGVTLNELNAREAGISSTKGVYLTSISRSSAAEKAGLRAGATGSNTALGGGGDVITAVNGREVTSADQFSRIIDGYNVGDTVKLTVIRSDRTIDVSAMLQEWTGR